MDTPKTREKLVLKHPERKGVNTLADLANNYEEMDALVQTTSLNALRRLKPGPAQHHLHVEIHTRQAYGLILGRSRQQQIEHNGQIGKEQSSIMGLFGFVKQTNTLINSSLQGDPFADTILLKIEKLLKQFDDHISAAVATTEHMIKNVSDNGVKSRKMSSKEPSKVNILFTSPYGMKLLMLIVKYDHWVRLYLPIRQLGIFDHDTWVIPLNEARNIFRKLMNATPHYVAYGLTRDSFQLAAQPEQKPLQKHIAKMTRIYGQIPEAVLNYETRPALIYTRNFRHPNANIKSEDNVDTTTNAKNDAKTSPDQNNDATVMDHAEMAETNSGVVADV